LLIGMKLFLGVDGGQSTTTAVIGDERGRVLGTGHGGPCNHAAAGEGRAKLERAVTESVSAACVQAGLASTVEFASACFGMSGGPDDKRDILAGLLRADRLLVTTDAEIALAGATATGQGIIVIAGTGSIAIGRNAADERARAGGWGHIFGDEGSAFDIVRQALRAALRMEEGWGPATALRQVLLEATACRDVNEVLHRFYAPTWPRDRVASLAALVDGAATGGDRVALEILNASAQQLASLAVSVRAQLWKQDDRVGQASAWRGLEPPSAAEAVDVVYSGGVFGSQRLLERFRLLVELQAGTRCRPPLYSAAQGALLAAYRQARLQLELQL
jgi:N-acetylglucosamine kinase-like BadF-type ATPase